MLLVFTQTLKGQGAQKNEQEKGYPASIDSSSPDCFHAKARYSREIEKMEKQVLGSVEKEPLFALLQTIPGVGKILALTIYYEAGEIERFGSPKQFCSCCAWNRAVQFCNPKGKGQQTGQPAPQMGFHAGCLHRGSILPGCEKIPADPSGAKALKGKTTDLHEHRRP